MAEVQILDNFIPKQNQLILENLIDSEKFYWFYNSTTIHKDSKNTFLGRRKSDHQFTHLLYIHQPPNDAVITSRYYEQVAQCFPLPEFKTHRLGKIKANLTVPGKRKDVQEPHRDSKYEGAVTYLYYVNDSDGDTRIYHNWMNTQRIKPKKGRLVRFPSNTKHSGNVPFNYQRRIVLNIVFQPHGN